MIPTHKIRSLVNDLLHYYSLGYYKNVLKYIKELRVILDNIEKKISDKNGTSKKNG
jgi:hypothetical protein